MTIQLRGERDVRGRSVEMAMPRDVWGIGIQLWEATDRGRGLGREAVALLTSHLFEQEDAHRVQASTDVESSAMRRVFDALGFVEEGTLRSFMPMDEEPPRDYEMYGPTASAWMRNP